MSYDAEPSIRAVKTILVRQARYRNNVKLIRYINTAIDKVVEAKQPQDVDFAYRIQSDHYADFVKAMKFKDEGEIASTELALNMVHEKLTTEVTSGIGAHISRIQLLIQSLCELDVSILECEEHEDVL
jgi:DNA mismatch repair ATPase MutS